MVSINDLIHIHEKSIEPEICDFLITVFDQSTHLHESIENEGKPNFTQFNLTKYADTTNELNSIHKHLIKQVYKYRDIYYEFVDSRVFPSEHAFEQFRIKRYNTGGEDRFDTHVDVKDYSTSRRFLSFFWYLNDVDIGGETVFIDDIIKPEKGKLVIFPPLWMFPHKGEPPLSGPKYILTGYLHYK